MKLSIVITTQGNRPEELIRFFRGLQVQDSDKIELIIVDQSQDDIVVKLIETINLKCEIKYIKSNKVSLSEARNLGLKFITGNYVCFPDDDCWYEKNIINSILEKFEKNINVDIFCFNVFDPNSNLYYGRNREKYKKDKEITLNNIFTIPISIGIFIRINKKEDIFFDELLGVGCNWGSGEETDLLIRLLNKGYKIKFSNDIKIYHPVLELKLNEIEKSYKYSLGFGATIAKAITNNKKNIFLMNEFLTIIIKSYIAMGIYFSKDKIKYNFYKKRLIGSIKGYKEYKSYYYEKK